jgi:uncharacterized protein YbgA (DUF1722 family)
VSERHRYDSAERERRQGLRHVLRELAHIDAEGRPADLMELHARCKYLLLAYDETAMRELGRLVATQAERPREESIALYRGWINKAFERPATVGGHINALMHAFGHVSSQLSPEERAGFLEQLTALRDGRVTLESVRSTLHSWITRVDVPYLAGQIYFTIGSASHDAAHTSG